MWATETGGATAWTVLAVCVVLLAAGTVVKYLVPGRRLKATACPPPPWWSARWSGLVGFFVIPVVGLFVGFPVGVYVAERVRVGGERAWPSTWRRCAPWASAS